MIRRLFLLILFCAFILSPVIASAITIPTVSVGDAGYAIDLTRGGLYGGVICASRIGTTEVANAHHADFLNAKAASAPRESTTRKWPAKLAAVSRLHSFQARPRWEMSVY
jgi:hypothetical protein